MTYNIHIHLGDQEQQGEQEQQGGKPPQKHIQNESNKQSKSWIGKILNRIQCCHNWRSFYQLDEDLQNLGLLLTDTENGNRILCRVEDGVPITSDIIDDYIFVGNHKNIDEEISERMSEVILDFVNRTSGKPVRDLIATNRRPHTALYGNPIRIDDNEEHLQESQEQHYISTIVNPWGK